MTHSYNLEEIERILDKSAGYWKSFIEIENFELGVLKLEPGMKDTQSPHKSDEVYFVLEGDGYLRIGEKDFAVKPKQALYVPKDTAHYFHSNTVPILAYYGLN